MEEITLTIELYKDRDTFCAYLSDNIGGSGITCRGSNPQEAAEELAPYIADYYYPREEEQE